MLSKKEISKGKYWLRAWSLIEGCSPVSEGCLNCWSASQAYMRSHQKNPKIRARYGGLAKIVNGRPTFKGKINLMVDDLEKPLKVKKPMVWSTWNDLFHEDVSMRFIEDVIKIIHRCPQHTFLVLTKRPENIPDKLYGVYDYSRIARDDCLPNLYFGVTIECTKYMDRLDDLIKIPGKHFVNLEPLLGPIDLKLHDYAQSHSAHSVVRNFLDGVILGGETGPKARPMHPEWVQSVRDQCVGAGVPFFFKQWGEWTGNPGWYLQENISPSCKSIIKNRDDKDRVGTSMGKIGKKAAGRLLDGREWNELPWRN